MEWSGWRSHVTRRAIILSVCLSVCLFLWLSVYQQDVGTGEVSLYTLLVTDNNKTLRVALARVAFPSWKRRMTEIKFFRVDNFIKRPPAISISYVLYTQCLLIPHTLTESSTEPFTLLLLYFVPRCAKRLSSVSSGNNMTDSLGGWWWGR